jgi:hypothetical protein
VLDRAGSLGSLFAGRVTSHGEYRVSGDPGFRRIGAVIACAATLRGQIPVVPLSRSYVYLQLHDNCRFGC